VSAAGSGGIARTCEAGTGPLGNIGGAFGILGGNATCTVSFTVTVGAATPAGDLPLSAVGTSEVTLWSAFATIHVVDPLSATGTSIAVPYAGSQNGAVTASGGTMPYGFAPGTAPAKGFVTVSADGSFTYTAHDGETGADQFTIVVSDSGVPAQSATATVDVMIAPEPLVVFGDAIAVSYTGSGDGAVTASGGTPPYTFTVGTAPAKGTVVLNADGTFSYTANADASGSDSFTYTVTDSDAGEIVLLAATTGTVELTITASPTPSPTVDPTPSPTAEPTAEPTPSPTAEPTAVPTIEPTVAPTVAPTQAPAKPTPASLVVTALPNTGNGAGEPGSSSLAWLLLGGAVLAMTGFISGWRRQHSR
jgi:hypothetical protein